jgi:hypothetical protein
MFFMLLASRAGEKVRKRWGQSGSKAMQQQRGS